MADHEPLSANMEFILFGRDRKKRNYHDYEVQNKLEYTQPLKKEECPKQKQPQSRN